MAPAHYGRLRGTYPAVRACPHRRPPATAQAAPHTPLGHIYWANASGNTIGRAYLDGSGVDQDFITGASGPSNVLVHGQYIYWGNATACTEDGACDGSIGRANLDGTDVNEHFIPADTPYGLAVYGQYIYWGSTGIGKIGRADLNGSDVNPSFITGLNQPDGVVVNGQNIYWANNGSNTIGEANLDGTKVNQGLITGPRGRGDGDRQAAHLLDQRQRRHDRAGEPGRHRRQRELHRPCR